MSSRLALALFACGSVLVASDLERAFQQPPDDARIMMRWWWFGPAVTKPRLDHEMRTMRAGGIGGFEVQPVYPLQLDGNLRFLSPEFLDALRFTAEKAKELGLRFDLTLGSGWPYGGPQIPLSKAAGRLRVEKGTPTLREGERLIATVDGLSFVASHTRQMVKRPSVGAEGYVISHYDRSALDLYLREVGDKLMKPLDGREPFAIFCDSLESFGSDWSDDLLEQFHKRRRYDLKPYLPALVSDIGPKTKGVRHDWGLTLTELLEENFMAPMQQYAQQHGTKFRIQGYGIPPAVLSSNAYADISEGEGSQWKVVRASRWASSANHLYGRPVTTSETWTWLHSPVFRATPLDVKAEADIHFLQGINQLIGHGWPYTPEGVEYPGWRFYASGVFNDANPWWIVMPDLAKYLQRISYLLRQGKPANDVALYLPNADVWSHFRAGHVHMIEQLREHVGPVVMPQILDSGYGLDFIDDRTLTKLGSYRVVVLPGVEIIPVESMRKLEEFARKGGIVIATRTLPAAAPGLRASDADTAEIKTIASRLFKQAVPDDGLGAALRSVLPPDMALASAAPEIGFIHRTTADEDVYFIANTGNTPRSTRATFRIAGREPEWWDAFAGRSAGARVVNRTSSSVTVDLELHPYESRVLVFRAKAARPEPKYAAGPALDISTGWTVKIGNRTSAIDKLSSWTEDEATRFYSGVGTYTKSVSITPVKGTRVQLDFGEGTALPIPPVDMKQPSAPGMRAWFEGPVREAAVVYVNGKRAGSVWCPPYKLDVTDYVKPGMNKFRIEVANLALNHMAGRPLPDYKELRAKYGNRFDPQDMDKVRPIPSGLLGPIRLVTWRSGAGL